MQDETFTTQSLPLSSRSLQSLEKTSRNRQKKKVTQIIKIRKRLQLLKKRLNQEIVSQTQRQNAKNNKSLVKWNKLNLRTTQIEEPKIAIKIKMVVKTITLTWTLPSSQTLTFLVRTQIKKIDDMLSLTLRKNNQAPKTKIKTVW